MKRSTSKSVKIILSAILAVGVVALGIVVRSRALAKPIETPAPTQAAAAPVETPAEVPAPEPTEVTSSRKAAWTISSRTVHRRSEDS